MTQPPHNFTANTPWAQKVQAGQIDYGLPPQPRDLRLQSAGQTQAQFVSSPGILTRIFNHIAENPMEFALSTGASMAVRAGLGLALAPWLGPGIATAIAAAMLTSIVLSVGKELISGSPSTQDLATAQNAQASGGILSRALNRSLWSGAIAGLTGIALSPILENMDIGSAAEDVEDKAKDASDTVAKIEPGQPIPYEGPYTPPPSVQEEIEHLRMRGINEVQHKDDMIYGGWRRFENLQIDHAITRDFSSILPNLDRGTSIPNNIGFDGVDAQNMLEYVNGKDIDFTFPFPDEMLSEAQYLAFEGKTILVDVGHYNIINYANNQYNMDLGAVYNANGEGINDFTRPDDLAADEKHTGNIRDLIDVNGETYTLKTIGPAFTKDGLPVAIEAHINLRSALHFGETARQWGADVVYTNLGRLDVGGVAEQLEHRKEIINQLAEAGHKPDMMLSFHADAMDATDHGMKFLVPGADHAGCNDLAEHLGENCHGEVVKDPRDLALLRNPPFAEEGVPTLIVELGNLANVEDNKVLRLYPWERLPGVFRGVADYFLEKGQVIAPITEQIDSTLTTPIDTTLVPVDTTLTPTTDSIPTPKEEEKGWFDWIFGSSNDSKGTTGHSR